MKTWIIGDTHFNHEKLRELHYGDRPYDFEGKIFKNLDKLPAEDVLICLGDVCMGNDTKTHEKYIMPLKCRKILVKGNHDKKSNSWYYNHGWNFVCKEMSDKFFGKKILFSHVPQLYDTAKYDLNIHAHLHANRHRGSSAIFKFLGRNLKLISMEFSHCQPVLISEEFVATPKKNIITRIRAYITKIIKQILWYSLQK